MKKTMIIIPAIDLMQGKVVRLSRGDPATAKYYDQWGTPVQVALRWKKEGASRLHLIDLDAAFSAGDNAPIIAKVANASCLPIQVGGGIRTQAQAERLLEIGVKHIILGALAFSNSDVIPKIQQKFGSDSVIVALDNKRDKVMVEGWKTETSFTLWAALERFISLGVTTFLITSIIQDGMLQGPDLETLSKACTYRGAKVIAAGGIGDLDDLVALKRIGMEGVVVGKALYEEKFTLRQAIETVKED